MSFLYLFLLISCTVCVSEKLPDHRKACEYKRILIDSSESKTERVRWILPEDKAKIVDEECQEIKRGRRALQIKKPREPRYRGFPKSGEESVLNNPEQFRTLLRDMLKNKRADPLILNELHELLIDREGIKMEPYIRLNEELHDVTCFDNRIIDITLKVMLPDELLIWKCEDIGHVINDTYEFYNLPPVWMVEDEDGETFKINLNDCQTNSYNQHFCATNTKVYLPPNCSVNNVLPCQKTVVLPSKMNGSQSSYSRKIPNGIVVHGTFRKISKKAKKNPPQRPTSLELVPLIARVHYFSYNTSKVMSSLSQKILS